MNSHEKELQNDIAARLVELGFGVQQEVRYQQHDTCNPHKSWRQHRCDLYVIAPTTWRYWRLWSPFVIECKVGRQFGGGTGHLRAAQKQCKAAMLGVNFRAADDTQMHRPRMGLIASHDTWFDPNGLRNGGRPVTIPSKEDCWLHVVSVLWGRSNPSFEQSALSKRLCSKTYWLNHR